MSNFWQDGFYLHWAREQHDLLADVLEEDDLLPFFPKIVAVYPAITAIIYGLTADLRICRTDAEAWLRLFTATCRRADYTYYPVFDALARMDSSFENDFTKDGYTEREEKDATNKSAVDKTAKTRLEAHGDADATASDGKTSASSLDSGVDKARGLTHTDGSSWGITYDTSQANSTYPDMTDSVVTPSAFETARSQAYTPDTQADNISNSERVTGSAGKTEGNSAGKTGGETVGAELNFGNSDEMSKGIRTLTETSGRMNIVERIKAEQELVNDAIDGIMRMLQRCFWGWR